MTRDSHVVFPALQSCEPQMAACLARDLIAMNAQQAGKLFSAHIAGASYRENFLTYGVQPHCRGSLEFLKMTTHSILNRHPKFFP